jgi:hypothetical protein
MQSRYSDRLLQLDFAKLLRNDCHTCNPIIVMRIRDKRHEEYASARFPKGLM